MTCPTCNRETSHLKILLPSGQELCHNCGGFSESGGVRTDKILTRNSDRVREEQHHHEGDMITPYVLDKNTNQMVLNHDFVELHPHQAAVTFTPEELAAAGHGRLVETVQEDDHQAEEVEFKGDTAEGVKAAVQQLPALE